MDEKEVGRSCVRWEEGWLLDSVKQRKLSMTYWMGLNTGSAYHSNEPSHVSRVMASNALPSEGAEAWNAEWPSRQETRKLSFWGWRSLHLGTKNIFSNSKHFQLSFLFFSWFLLIFYLYFIGSFREFKRQRDWISGCIPRSLSFPYVERLFSRCCRTAGCSAWETGEKARNTRDLFLIREKTGKFRSTGYFVAVRENEIKFVCSKLTHKSPKYLV